MAFTAGGLHDKRVRAALRNGGVGVIPTDTLYGIVGSALRSETVLRIYRARRRNPKKPVIVLIASPRDIGRFGLRFDAPLRKFLRAVWPGKVSVALPLRRGSGRRAGSHEKFVYLHRGIGFLAFRLPARKDLRRLLRAVGPLVAPSANIEGEPPASTLEEAKKYFGDHVDFYVDGGRIAGKPSTLVMIEKGKLRLARRGAVPFRALVRAFPVHIERSLEA